MTAENQSRCTPEADLELLGRYKNGEEEALSALLKVHEILLKYWVGRVSDIAPWANSDDLMQEASIGFIQAVRTFDSETDDFHSEARAAARRKMFESREIRRVKRTLYRHYIDVADAQDELIEKLNRRPTIEELATATNLSMKQVETALNVSAAFPLPLTEAGDNLTEDSHYDLQLIKDALKELNSEHAEVLIRYYFEGQTDAEIAQDLGSSEDAIKKKRWRLIRKLRDIISGKGGRDDGN
jgi:RNA polymerase sigma factor (sigma-70 family)